MAAFMRSSLHHRQILAAPFGDAAAQPRHVLEAGLAQHRAYRPRVLAHLAGHHHGLGFVLLQLADAPGDGGVRNVHGIHDVAGAKVLLVAHIQHQRAFAVHQIHELLRGDGASASLHFVAHE